MITEQFIKLFLIVEKHRTLVKGFIMKSIVLIEGDTQIFNHLYYNIVSKDIYIIPCDTITLGYQLAIKHIPDIILCSEKLYKQGIDDFQKKFREDEIIKNIPLIFTTEDKTIEFEEKQTITGFEYRLFNKLNGKQLHYYVLQFLKKNSEIVKQSEKKLDELRGSISFALPHEMFTPLNGIIGFSEVLMNEYTNLSKEEIKEMLRYINRDALRLKRITQNFIAYAQIEIISRDPEKVYELRKTYFMNPKDNIKQVAEQVANEYNRIEDLTLDVQDTAIRISEGYLRKILEEVIDNAFKFSEKGKQVNIKMQVEPENVFLLISDKGRGMTSKQINQVGAYMQFNRTIYEQQGSGLGLILAKRITELHNAIFKIESHIDKGTTVKLIFET